MTRKQNLLVLNLLLKSFFLGESLAAKKPWMPFLTVDVLVQTEILQGTLSFGLKLEIFMVSNPGLGMVSFDG